MSVKSYYRTKEGLVEGKPDKCLHCGARLEYKGRYVPSMGKMRHQGGYWACPNSGRCVAAPEMPADVEELILESEREEGI